MIIDVLEPALKVEVRGPSAEQLSRLAVDLIIPALGMADEPDGD